MGAVTLEYLVGANPDFNIEVARGPAIAPGFAFTGQPDSIPGIHARWHFYGQGPAFIDAPAPIAIITGVNDLLSGAATLRTGLLDRKHTL